jgi:hypothetical protein
MSSPIQQPDLNTSLSKSKDFSLTLTAKDIVLKPFFNSQEQRIDDYNDENKSCKIIAFLT